MSKLNDAIKPWLLANGFYTIDELPDYLTDDYVDYMYYNDEFYIYFKEGDMLINAVDEDYNIQFLNYESAEQVIAYFKQHGNIPEQETKQVDIPLAQQMWDYLLSIGFEVIDNNDSRLGCQTGWKYNIAKGNLCAYHATLTAGYIYLVDTSSNKYRLSTGISTVGCLEIHSVSGLQAWLQNNGHLDDNNEEQVLDNTPKIGHDISLEFIAKLQKMQQQIDLLTNKSKKWKKRAKKAEKIVNRMSKVVVY